MSRLPVIGELARLILAGGTSRFPQTPSTGPLREQALTRRVAIDGVDAAGKSTLAAELAARLPRAVRLSADDFLRPPEERYRQGRESPVGYFEDSFDHARLRRAVQASDGLLLVDGIFLFRDELNDLWDFRIFLKIALEESIRRGVARDGREKEELCRRRYAPAQRRYLDDVRPAELANVVVDNTDVARPSISPGRASSR